MFLKLRSLKLLLILLLCLVKESQSQTPAFNLDNFNNRNSEHQSLVQQVRLWSYCSGRFVQITRAGSKGVDANGEKEGNFSQLLIISINGGFVRIQGMASKLYLCFNKKGKLRARYRPLKSSCDFSHNLTSNGYDTFKLRDKAEWSIGFKKRRGKKLPGFIRPGKNEDECHHFGLINLDKTVITQPVDFRRVMEWNFSKKGKSMSEQRKRPRKIRHNRKQKRRRGRRRKNRLRTVGTT
ncbi:fibroblast growth factor 18-like isoform X2 [Crassostrea virginica]|uniref:Fibroblast growth factor 18-like isoform X2 n=1 Tax=Crassostrea virginica TaxID=6565 RepID=A0A8B8AAM2_CRAVI|nr:fibroblast growth factor 18-like isoform X2 [Crassostrea virginica]